MSALSVILEDFEAPGFGQADGDTAQENSARAQQMRAAAYAEGYAAGEAAAAVRRETDAQLFNTVAVTIENALNDTSGRLKIQFCDALKTAIEKIFPPLAEKGFPDAVASAITETIRINGTDEIVLTVAPSRKAPVEQALSLHCAEKAVSVEADASLSELAAKAVWRDAGIELDFGAAIEQSLSALENTITQIKDRAE